MPNPKWVVDWRILGHEMRHIFDCFRNSTLLIRVPSSSCSATSSTGNSAGMILLGVVPGTTEYFEKSVTPLLRRKSSSVTIRPFTSAAGARNRAIIASEKIVWIQVRSLMIAASRSTYRLPQVIDMRWISTGILASCR